MTTTSRRLIWLALLLALLSLGLIAKMPCGPEGCGADVAPAPPTGRGTGHPVGDDISEGADPWALSATGARLGEGFGPGEGRPPLLP